MTFPGERERCLTCTDGQGWVIGTVDGPVVDGRQTKVEQVRPCPQCNPLHPNRITAPRDDKAIQRHRRHQDRRMGRDPR